MKGDGDETAFGPEQVLGRSQAPREFLKLVIEIEAERLESPGCRVLGVIVPAAKHSGDDFRKFPRP